MKRIVIVAFALFMAVFAMAGCQKKYVGTVVHENYGLSCADQCRGTRNYENMSIEYELKRDASTGLYAFDGQAMVKGRHSSGDQMRKKEFYLFLIRDNVIVDTVRLNAQGMSISRPIKLFKEFETAEAFDEIEFTWSINYMF